MLAKLQAFALVGIDALPVEVEVDVAPGLPKTVLVGLPELAVRESIHRIERALANLGYQRPTGRTIINLAPADLRKDAGAFDLPIALGMLIATGQIHPDQLTDCAAVGELALDGSVRPVKGILSIAMAARDRGLKRLLVPRENAREGSVVQELEVFSITSLAEAVGLVTGAVALDPTVFHFDADPDARGQYPVDFAEVRGQEFAKRAMIIAASGGHNLLMIGSPGSGKSMLSKRLPTILPPLTSEESLDTTRIYSAVGMLTAGQALLSTRPFRSPHHTISDAGMVGGGTIPQPGEISLAHNGVLFLDELPEFNRKSLEVLRQPLEEGNITISRASGSTTFPADFILIAAMNPCQCGYLGDPRRACKCSPIAVEKYMGRLSGPLLDRIDLHVEVPAVAYAELSAQADGTSSVAMRDQVLAARERQRVRFGRDGRMLNARMFGRLLRKHCVLDAEGQSLLKSAMDDLGLSARAHDRILKVARTIADLGDSEAITASHIAESIGYRTLDRKLWMK
ncbi:MAG: YifB family Mg chelatase-like AAA ATPase [Bacteroidales bacterium]|nr:YifB family Mg chelatase-like AAA ATPase [Bacteroidales bacterium]